MAIVALSPAVRLRANAGTKHRLAKLLRSLGAAADICFHRFFAALHESRRRQAARFITENRNLTLMAEPANASQRRPPAKRVCANSQDRD